MMKASRMAKIVLVTYREWEEQREDEWAEQERTKGKGQRKIKTLIIFSTLQAAIGFAFISLWYENRFAEN